MSPKAILFDFDGVLVDSEWAGNTFIARWLTENGHPTTPSEAIENFMGTGGPAFEAAIERWTGTAFPAGLQEERMKLGLLLLREGIAEVAGARDFVSGLPADYPIAVTSSATSRWLTGHLDHLGLRERFGDHVYSGREHVERMKPAPDLYLYAADRLGIGIEDTLIIEDSPVGIQGAVASGAQVVGLLAGSHIRDGHRERLVAAGAHRCADTFAEIAEYYF